MRQMKRRMTLWRHVRYAIETTMVKTAATVIPWLPRRAVCGIAWLLGTLAWLCDAGGRRIGMENLRVIFADRFNTAERRRIIWGSYRVFTRTFLDLFWSSRLTPGNIHRYVTLEYDTPAAEEAMKANHFIIITAHYGAFETAGIAKAVLGSPGMTVAQDFRNPALTEIFRRLRSAGGRQSLIPREGAILRLLKWVKKGGSAAALVDLTVKPGQAAVPVKRFGLWTSGSLLQGLLAERTGAPVLPLLATHMAGGRVHIRLMHPVLPGKDDTMANLSQRCWDLFEPNVRDHPEQWMWMYRHWLYRPANSNPASFPCYSRVLPAFDELLQQHGIQPPAAPPV